MRPIELSRMSLAVWILLLSVSLSPAQTEGDVPHLILRLKSADLADRTVAAASLSLIGPGANEAIPALVEALSDKVGDIRLLAISALNNIGPTAIPALIEAVKMDVARSGLDVMSFQKALVADRSSITFSPSASALMVVANSAPAPALVSMLEEPNGVVRLQAVSSLVSLSGGPPPDAMPALVQVLKDEDAFVRNTVFRHLEKIGPAAVPALVDALKEEEFTIPMACLEKIGAAAVPRLVDALKDHNWVVRKKAAFVLGIIGQDDPPVVRALTEALEDDNGSVRVAAADALSRMQRN